MHGIIGSFRIGEDIAIALDAMTGDPGTVTAITAKMKPARVLANRIVLDDAAPDIALTVTLQGSSGWLLALASTATADLEPGIYGIDARLAIGGGVEITEQSAFIALSRAALA